MNIDQEAFSSNTFLDCISAAAASGVLFLHGKEAAGSVQEWFLNPRQRRAALGIAGALI